MQIYDRIRILCKSKGVTVTGTEKELGFARGSLCKIDRNKPSADRIQRLADFLGVSANYLMTGEEAEYYANPESARVAQEILDDRDLRALLDAAKGCPPEVIRSAAELFKRFKETNPNG